VKWRNVVEISKGVYWVGVRDWNRRLFDALIPLPKGTTYNSYLIIGENETALIDTVNPGFEEELKEKIEQVTDLKDISYIVMNHAEPDHSGAIPHLMSINTKARLVTTDKGARMARAFYGVPQEKIKVVSDQEKINLGGKTLSFIMAPMLHWPETMFTYLQENRILFPCDFFGAHVAKGLYDEEIEDLMVHAQRYFGEIMMPFRFMAGKALKKIENLEIDIIAPSHGPIHKKPQRIVEAYNRWAEGETKQKATIVYVSMWGSTEKMVNVIAETLTSEGIEVALYNLVSIDIGDLAKDLVDSEAIVLGTPTVLNGMHPLALYAAYLVKALRPPAKFAAVLSSYGWGGGAIKQLQEILGSSRIELVGAIKVNGPPSAGDIKQIQELGGALAKKIKHSREKTESLKRDRKPIGDRFETKRIRTPLDQAMSPDFL